MSCQTKSIEISRLDKIKPNVCRAKCKFRHLFHQSMFNHRWN